MNYPKRNAPTEHGFSPLYPLRTLPRQPNKVANIFQDDKELN